MRVCLQELGSTGQFGWCWLPRRGTLCRYGPRNHHPPRRCPRRPRRRARSRKSLDRERKGHRRPSSPCRTPCVFRDRTGRRRGDRDLRGGAEGPSHRRHGRGIHRRNRRQASDAVRRQRGRLRRQRRRPRPHPARPRGHRRHPPSAARGPLPGDRPGDDPHQGHQQRLHRRGHGGDGARLGAPVRAQGSGATGGTHPPPRRSGAGLHPERDARSRLLRHVGAGGIRRAGDGQPGDDRHHRGTFFRLVGGRGQPHHAPRDSDQGAAQGWY